MSLAGRYLVHLPQFEGPLALLLYLIRKEEMDIFNININSITREYLEHIRMMKELDLELAGEFVAMAATLIQIKARMLLPQYNEEGEVVESEDPRKELVQRLLEYQLYQDAGKKLYTRPLLNRDTWARAVPREWRDELRGDEGGEIILEDEGLFGLISSYRRAVKKAERMVHRVRPKTQSIAGRILEIKDSLLVGARVLLRDLLGVGASGSLIGVAPDPSVAIEGDPGAQVERAHSIRDQLLITFLSMLELGRLGFVSIFQNETYGDIHIEAKKVIDGNGLERVQEFDSQNAEAVAESIINEAIVEELERPESLNQEIHALHTAQQLGLEPVFEGVVEAVDEYRLTQPGSAEELATDAEITEAEKELGLSEADLIMNGELAKPDLEA